MTAKPLPTRTDYITSREVKIYRYGIYEGENLIFEIKSRYKRKVDDLVKKLTDASSAETNEATAKS